MSASNLVNPKSTILMSLRYLPQLFNIFLTFFVVISMCLASFYSCFFVFIKIVFRNIYISQFLSSTLFIKEFDAHICYNHGVINIYYTMVIFSVKLSIAQIINLMSFLKSSFFWHFFNHNFDLILTLACLVLQCHLVIIF